MGILSKLFGGSSSTPIEKPAPEPTARPIDEDQFWRIVQTSIENCGGDRECQQKILVRELEKVDPVDIIGFRLLTDKLLYDTYNSKFWCAGYLMNGGCSDDMFEYFRLWVISKGRAVFEAAAKNPDSIVIVDADGLEFYEFESFWYVALKAFKNVTGKDLYDFIDYEHFKYGEGNYPPFEFDWRESNPDSMKAICPQLFERFANE